MPTGDQRHGCILEGIKPLKHVSAADIVADIISQNPAILEAFAASGSRTAAGGSFVGARRIGGGGNGLIHIPSA